MSSLLAQLERRAPAIGDRLARANWRLRNRSRAFDADEVPQQLRPIVERLRSDGVVITDVDSVFGNRALYDAAAVRADELYRAPRADGDAAAGSKATFLTKLVEPTFDYDDPFLQLALHPNALAVANGYLELFSRLRAVDLWLTKPTEGPAIQTQLWHRDGDDIVNLKMFVYFTDVRAPAGPLRYAPGTHPFGDRRKLPERDEQARSTDEQLAEVVPEDEWILCEGPPGTIVFADTCGYHKQQKPETDERLLTVAHYVSGTPFVPPTVEIRGADPDSLSEAQHWGVYDRAPA